MPWKEDIKAKKLEQMGETYEELFERFHSPSGENKEAHLIGLTCKLINEATEFLMGRDFRTEERQLGQDGDS